MCLGFSSRNELLSHCHRERQVGEPIAMQMAEFTASDTKLDAAEAMR